MPSASPLTTGTPGGAEAAPDRVRHLGAVRARPAGADHRDGGLLAQDRERLGAARPRTARPAGRAARAAAAGTPARACRAPRSRPQRAARARASASNAVEKRERLLHPACPAAAASSSSLGQRRAGRGPPVARRRAAPRCAAPGGRSGSARRRQGSQPSITPRPAPSCRAGMTSASSRSLSATASRPSRSAIVRATRSTRSWPRPLSGMRSRTASRRPASSPRAAPGAA